MFEMGAKFEEDGWSVAKNETAQKVSKEIKTPQKHRLYFAKEKRRGKVVTIAKPFFLKKKAMQETLKTLKKKLGCGGTVKEDSLEFQGEIRDKLETQLKKLDFGIK